MHAASYVCSLFTRCCVESLALHSFANGVYLPARTLSSSPSRTILNLAQIRCSDHDLLQGLLGWPLSRSLVFGIESFLMSCFEHLDVSPGTVILDTSASHIIITELMLPLPSFPCKESILLSNQTHVPGLASIAAQADSPLTFPLVQMTKP